MSTAAATSPSAGYSRDRPATRPMTFGSRSAFRQPGERHLGIVGDLAAEQQRGQGGGGHDPLHVLHHRDLEPGVGRRRAQAGGDGEGPDHRLGRQVVADAAVHAVRDERLDHGHQLPAGQVGHGLGARLHGGRGGRVVGVDPEQHLAAVEAHPRDRRGVVPGEPVVDLEDRPGQAAPVHRADDDLAVAARRAAAGPPARRRCRARRSTPGRASATQSRSSRSARSAMASRFPAGPQRPAGRVIGGHDHQPAVRADEATRRGGRPRRRLGHLLGRRTRVSMTSARRSANIARPRQQGRPPRPRWAWRRSRQAGRRPGPRPRWRTG